MAKKKSRLFTPKSSSGMRTTVAPASQDMAETIVPVTSSEPAVAPRRKKVGKKKAAKKRVAMRPAAAKATKVGKKSGKKPGKKKGAKKAAKRA